MSLEGHERLMQSVADGIAIELMYSLLSAVFQTCTQVPVGIADHSI